MSAAVDPKTGGVFFGEKGNPGNFYYFHSSTGLSTIVSGLKWPGVTSTIVDNDGRVYFSDFNWPNNVYSWSPSTGLSTIISNAQCAGCMEAIGIHRTTGRAYIGTYSSGSGHVYTFMPSSTTGTNASVRRASQTGEASNQPLNLAYNSGTYTGMTQDVNRAIYLLETSGKTVDRYTYDGGDSRYERQSQLAWTTWATTVGAIAIDSSTNGIALLDTGNKQIDIYADRTVNGTPAAPTSLSISGTTTPTGLAVSSRTGDYLVLDSALQSSTNVRLFVYSNTGTLKRTIAIDVTTANLSVSATGETDFKILYNDQDNILYLLSPSLGRVFGLSLPEYL
jgi:hypothetical protein